MNLIERAVEEAEGVMCVAYCHKVDHSVIREWLANGLPDNERESFIFTLSVMQDKYSEAELISYMNNQLINKAFGGLK